MIPFNKSMALLLPNPTRGPSSSSKTKSGCRNGNGRTAGWPRPARVKMNEFTNRAAASFHAMILEELKTKTKMSPQVSGLGATPSRETMETAQSNANSNIESRSLDRFAPEPAPKSSLAGQLSLKLRKPKWLARREKRQEQRANARGGLSLELAGQRLGHKFKWPYFAH